MGQAIKNSQTSANISRRKGIHIPNWVKIIVTAVWTAIICLAIIPMIESQNATNKTIEDCKAKANTIQSAEANYDETSKQVILRLWGFSTERETPIAIDGSVVRTSQNTLDGTCYRAGFDLYEVNEQFVISDCSIRKIGFETNRGYGKEYIKEDASIQVACMIWQSDVESELQRACELRDELRGDFEWNGSDCVRKDR